MTWFRVGGGSGVPASLKSRMNAVLNKKFGTAVDYPPNGWPDDVNLLGPLPEGTASGSIVTFSDGADDVPIKSCEVVLSASLDGYSSVNVVQMGKNLVDESTIENGYQININSGLPTAWNGRCATTSPIMIHGGNITVSFSSTDSLVRLMYSFFKNGTFIERVANIESGTTINAHDYDTMYIGFANVNGVAITKDVLSNIQIEVGSSASSYEQYQTPTTYTASLGRTIYGGEVDIVNGKCEPTNWLDDTLANLEQGSINGSTGANENANNRVRNASAIPFPYDEIVSSYTWTIPSGYKVAIRPYDANGNFVQLPSLALAFITQLPQDLIGQGITQMRFVLAKTDNSAITPSEMVEVGYILNKGNTAKAYSPYFAPFTFDGQEVPTRLGYNAFWSEQGDMNVTYRRDIDLALQALSGSRGLMMASPPAIDPANGDQGSEESTENNIETEGEQDAR